MTSRSAQQKAQAEEDKFRTLLEFQARHYKVYFSDYFSANIAKCKDFVKDFLKDFCLLFLDPVVAFA